MNDVVRLCEWGRAELPGWNSAERAELRRAVNGWRASNNLNTTPLTCNENGLHARQWVGVVEVAGRTIEIYPKLDAAWLDKTKLDAADEVAPVMRNLLWMLDVATHRDVADTDTASLNTLESFYDLFAWMLARRLFDELQFGLPHRYQLHHDDLTGVRGRINLTRQVTTLWDRHDRLACIWDEFTPDTPLLRLCKCACRFLQTRATHPSTIGLLDDCVAIMDGVSDVPPFIALHEAREVRWDRQTQRFRLAYELAQHLLQGQSPALSGGNDDTFVFLFDMNKVFENYAGAVLEQRFQTRVETQKYLGKLFQLAKGGIKQYADFLWQSRGVAWIGDAKYKHLAKGSQNALTFASLNTTEEETHAGHVLNSGDVRQLTVYAELAKLKNLGSPHLALLYPFTGTGIFNSVTAKSWNQSKFHLVPVRVGGFDSEPNLEKILPDHLYI